MPSDLLQSPKELRERIRESALAFRGYNVTNLGKTPELLAHPIYGPFIERRMHEVEQIYSDTLKQSIDLVGRLREKRESTIDTFAEDVALIVGVEMAHVDILEDLFGMPTRRAQLSIGYSIGELTTLVHGGVFELKNILPVPLEVAQDCASLADSVQMGILFTRGDALDFDAVRDFCLEISCEGNGIVAPSSHLAPNAVLLIGEKDTLASVEARKERFGNRVLLRRNQEKWPPIHTPIIRRKFVPCRSANHLYSIRHTSTVPQPNVISCASGDFSYTAVNAREVLHRWIDHPQRLWDGLTKMLEVGVEIVLHLGPEPNLIPATFERLSNNVSKQLGSKVLRAFGDRLAPGIAKQNWLTRVLSDKAVYLWAPYVRHIVVEDWLLTHTPE